MKRKDKILAYTFSILAVALSVFIIIQSCLDGGESTGQSSWVVELCKNVINFVIKDAINESNIGTFTTVIRKLVGHFSLFLVDGVFVYLSLYYWLKEKKDMITLLLFTLIFGLLLASLSEFIQSFVPGRSGELLDVLIDYGGYLLGTGITYLITYLIKKKA